VGCKTERARPEDCERIFNRLVEVELYELGFRDPVLAQRKQAQLHRVLEEGMGRCVGGRFRPDALACVQGATRAEDIVHGCLE
jgi:hypothetical protein